MRIRPLCLAIVSILAVSGLVGAVDASRVGVNVDVERWLSDLDTVVITIRWDEAADEAFVSLEGPENIEAIVQGGRYLDLGDRLSLGPVSPNQLLTLEIFGLEDGQVATLATERENGIESFLLVTTVGVHQGKPAVIDSQPYRIFEKEKDGRGTVTQSRQPEDPSVAINRSETTIVIESLRPKTAAVLMAEDPTNVDIPISAPTACGPSYAFSTVRQINVNAAPAGSVTTALEIHVIMSHFNTSQMTIAYSEDDYYWDPAHPTQGQFLWKDESFQVDLNRTWTRDKYNQELAGIGRDPNGWFQLWFVDCTGGAVGTLDYWSVEITYDTSTDFDLLADTISVDPDPAAPGGDIRVTWAGHVGGSDSIAGGFTSRVYLSSDTNITTGDTVLATIAESVASDPGDPFGSPAPGRLVTLPGGISDGTWYVGVIVDHNDVVDESNESNNTAWTALQVSTASDFDLVADSITPQAGSVTAGSSVNVNWFGHADAGNSGDISGNFTVGFYLSNDSNVTIGDTLLDRATVVGPTSPGEGFGASGRSLTIPGGTAAGTRYLGMIVDDTGGVAETNENNNVVASAISVTGGGGGQPDLVTSACSLSSSTVESGNTVTVGWTERNQGSADAGSFLTKVFLSSNPTWEGPGTDVKIGQLNLGPYAAGFQQPLSILATIPHSTADGEWYVLIVTDSDQQVTESNENNNLCSSNLTVGSGGGPVTSDRWLIPAAASAPGYSGSDWRTQIAITNPTDQQRQASVYYVSDSSSWPGVLLTGPINIGARRSHYVDDLLYTLRPTSGLVYVVFDAVGPVVTSRTYNQAADGSTYGQGIPGIPLIGGAAPGELILPMVHSGAGRFHTNLGLVQASTGSMTVEVSIYTAGGSLLAIEQRVVSDGWDQINDVFDKMGVGAATIEGGWIKVRLVSGSPDAWTCYASVVDKETGDPTYVGGVNPE